MTNAEQHLADMRERALRRLTLEVRSLDRALAEIESDATAAREAIREGRRVPGSSLGYGPVGHQSPFEVAQRTERVNAAINLAADLGATEEQINAAYKSEA